MAPSASLPPASAVPPGKVVMHRACDECRARKLACSKEPGGCSRCAREGIRCVYSPQKPMGRPKKRRHVEQDDFDESSQEWTTGEATSGGRSSNQWASAPNSAALGKSTVAPGPLNMIPAFDLPFSMGPQSQILADPFLDMDLSLFQAEGGVFDFDATSDDSSSDIQLTRGTVHRIFEAIGTFIFSPKKRDSSPSEASSSTTESDVPVTNAYSKAFPNVTCSCLSSIYLALESLTTMPDAITPAITIARSASKTAHDVISCPTCSLPLTENPLALPPIQSQQSTFLLSALLASLTNAYARVLELVDTATAEATSESRHIHFSFRELGGAWAQVPGSEGGLCMLSRGINETDLPPQLWRLAMRAVLRYEVYGLCTAPDDPLCAGDGGKVGHLGLARAVRRLEQRSLTRHEKLDQLYEAGFKAPACGSHPSMMGLKGVEKPHCMHVIECARLALDKLAIT